MTSRAVTELRAREVCFLLDAEGRVLWSDASTSPTLMPDSRTRWERIWAMRGQLAEIAHSHPLGGLHFSSIDEGTMRALDAALGKRLRYSVVTPDAMIQRTPADGESFVEAVVEAEPWWTALMRSASWIVPTA